MPVFSFVQDYAHLIYGRMGFLQLMQQLDVVVLFSLGLVLVIVELPESSDLFLTFHEFSLVVCQFLQVLSLHGLHCCLQLRLGFLEFFLFCCLSLDLAGETLD